ncbi:cobalt ECF transporter T component CbiQ [Candidatus Bathyarchaeota archaeon]|nr:cobalt ECF transporter T component CbiQ [Candidatus Bathyarchaeota archaeon]
MIDDFLRVFRDLMYLERYAGEVGVLQRVNPLAKVISLFLMILSAVVSKTLYPLAAIFGVLILLCWMSKISIRYFLKRVTLFIPLFAAAIASPLIFVTPGTSLATIMLGPLTIQPTVEGLMKAATFTFRIWVCVASLNLLVLTTRFSQLILSMDRLKLPRVFIVLTVVTYRYIYLFINEAYRMVLARDSRTVRREPRLQSLRSLANMLGVLLVRAYERGERVYLAMLARGLTPKARPSDMAKFRIGDWLFLTGSLGIFIIILATGLEGSSGW